MERRDMKIKILLSLILLFGLSISGYCADPTGQPRTGVMPETRIDGREQDKMINNLGESIPVIPFEIVIRGINWPDGETTIIEAVEYTYNEKGDEVVGVRPLDLEELNLNQDEGE
ncbi:MAG: hypothetical protein P9L98_04280 [Candidatus Kaelpia imicola]|nr:hypothetical protein [Candidatus Kaelpia imicola]